MIDAIQGRTEDIYDLYSNSIDVVTSLARYDLRRDMLKSGMLKAITPHAT